MRNTKYESGFTLVELLVAMVVTGIILGAVATLAYAFGTAYDAGDDTTRKQAQVRYATLRISELIRYCRLICSTPGNDLFVWRADDNGDGQINLNELVCIETGTSQNSIQLCAFWSGSNPKKALIDLQTVEQKQGLKNSSDTTITILIPECANVSFMLDPAVPWTRFVSISFELTENDIVRQYQINAALRSWAGHLLDGSGNLVLIDDD